MTAEMIPTILSISAAIIMGIIFPMVRSMYIDMKEQIAELRAEINSIKREINDHKLDSMRARVDCAKTNDCKI